MTPTASVSKRKSPRVAKEERLASLFKALADPSRCRIVDLLREAGELRVGDIAAAFEMSLNGVSKHLKVLEAAGLVTRRREGTAHYISMRWEALAPLADWLDVRRHLWDRRLDALDDRLQPKRPRKKR